MEKMTRHPDATRTVHRYRPLPPDRRPHPSVGDRTLTYEPLEHGEYPYGMPLAIRVTDSNGRSWVYLPIGGPAVDSLGFILEREP